MSLLPVLSDRQDILDDPLISIVHAARVRHYRRAFTAVAFVESRLSEPVSLGQVADVVFMDKSAFARYFKAKVGITFGNLTRLMKISRACRLLVGSDSSIGSVAAAVGFRNVGTFIRSFKIVTGMTPSLYRTEWLNGGCEGSTSAEGRDAFGT